MGFNTNKLKNIKIYYCTECNLCSMEIKQKQSIILVVNSELKERKNILQEKILYIYFLYIKEGKKRK